MVKCALALLHELLVQRKITGVLLESRSVIRSSMDADLTVNKSKSPVTFSNTTSRSLLLAIQRSYNCIHCDTYQMNLYSQSIICDLHCVLPVSFHILYTIKNPYVNNVVLFRWLADTVPFGVDTSLKAKDKTPYKNSTPSSVIVRL